MIFGFSPDKHCLGVCRRQGRVRSKRDAVLFAVVALMAILASFALMGAFAAFIAQTHGIVIGLLSAAALSIFLAMVALAIRAILRRRALRRQRLATTSRRIGAGRFNGRRT